MSNKNSNYAKMTPKFALQLAAPHTWPAAIMPCLIACACASVSTGVLSASLSLALLAICILMQSSVNTFNDYYDYVKGADSTDDNVEESDATLIYANINPKAARNLAWCFLVCAFLLGIYVIVKAGWIPLLLGLIGAIIVVLYSAGKTPISYLPIGELISGFVMGGLIPLASYQALTGSLNFWMLVIALPTIIGVALIMFTNNTCDIEKDETVSRKTLPVVLGRERTVLLYRFLIALWIVAIIGVVAVWFTSGIVVCVFMLLASIAPLKAIFNNPLLPQTRIVAMSQIGSLNVILGTFYAAAIFAGVPYLIW
ncbi:prenyltransferase [Adlercreutzia agrestimuris]|uniref:prenyltransferase n=1 Tax=Adlercreutzia agrestimuris TaxID=2941324 RepID=UPI00203FAB1E|nr:prenyltransferase [Adlercreutzia agrestimuris]